MATITGVNIYIDGVKHNSTPQPLTQATYDISNVKAAGAAFDVQFSYTYDDATESQLTAIQSYSLSTSQISLQNLVVDSNTEILDSNYMIVAAQPSNKLLSPNILYKNNKTIWPFLTNKANEYGILEYDSLFGLRPPHINKGAPLNFNTHDNPILHYEGDKLFLVQENDHNANPLKLHKSVSDNDSLIIEGNVQDISTNAMTYPNIYKNNGVTIIIGQYNDNFSGFIYNNSGNIEGAYADQKSILINDVDEVERYQHGIDNKQVSSDIIFGSVGRNDVPAIPVWFRYNIFRAVWNSVTNNLDYYTIDGTFIKSGEMTANEATSGQYYYTGSSTNQGYIPEVSQDQLGNVISVHGDGSGGYMLSAWKSEAGSTPTNTPINLPDAPTLVESSANSACANIIFLALNNIHVFFKVNNGVRVIVREYRTVDEGVSWTFIQDIDFGFDVVRMGLANNYLEIGNNKNFMLIAGGFGNLTSSSSDRITVGIKKAAFGSLQSTTNIYDSLPLITEASFNSSSILNYSIESGKITNTGTTIDSLIDQSPNVNDLVSNGSPVLDNETTPTEVTLDGINDFFSIDPSLLVPNKNYLILSLIDPLSGRASALNISNSINDTSFINSIVDNDTVNKISHQSRYNAQQVNTVIGDTVMPTGYVLAAWLYRGSYHDVPMWLNGKMQKRVMVDEPPVDEGSYILPNGNTNFEIGRLVRTSTNYFNFKMKHTSVHEISSEQDVLDRIKFLGNKYGITLLNAYR